MKIEDKAKIKIIYERYMDRLSAPKNSAAQLFTGIAVWLLITFLIVRGWVQATTPTIDQLAIVAPVIIIGLPLAISAAIRRFWK